MIIPAHAVAAVQCGACGLTLVVTTTPIGVNSTNGAIGHVCHGVLVPPIELTVSVKPESDTPALRQPCISCGTAYTECEISADDPDYTTDANGNHAGLCCEDCQHAAD